MAVPIHTVDGCEILHQLKTVVDYPIIYRVSTSFNHPFGCRISQALRVSDPTRQVLPRCSADHVSASALRWRRAGPAPPWRCRGPRCGAGRSGVGWKNLGISSAKEGWLVVEVYLLLWKMMEFVSWDDDIPFPIWWESHNPFHGSSHHQAFIGDFNDFMRFFMLELHGIFRRCLELIEGGRGTERITDTKY